ncbi:hypothetical protein M23134_03236 [Microscilla marina ATCC 23134]|uniref:Uncharacterized protein n=1 Tax=Microscilla marina ATCC 23134 TaxID=313606 RepID=A1ZGI1_MICM2|nr:hypothetical protein M23134_03236 [Microscilla marina ATCC 23134]
MLSTVFKSKNQLRKEVCRMIKNSNKQKHTKSKQNNVSKL